MILYTRVSVLACFRLMHIAGVDKIRRRTKVYVYKDALFVLWNVCFLRFIGSNMYIYFSYFQYGKSRLQQDPDQHA